MFELSAGGELEARPEAACEAELDEQWPYAGNKPNQRRLWCAVGHATNPVLAYVFGKRNTQKIERKNLNFRAWAKRLARKTVCCSKLELMHDTAIGLPINKVGFGRNIFT